VYIAYTLHILVCYVITYNTCIPPDTYTYLYNNFINYDDDDDGDDDDDDNNNNNINFKVKSSKSNFKFYMAEVH